MPHLIDQEREYEIVETVTLPMIDYENFITDMLVGRWFLEENAQRCRTTPSIRCILVNVRGRKEGVLVVPNGAYVKLAALLF